VGFDLVIAVEAKPKELMGSRVLLVCRSLSRRARMTTRLNVIPTIMNSCITRSVRTSIVQATTVKLTTLVVEYTAYGSGVRELTRTAMADDVYSPPEPAIVCRTRLSGPSLFWRIVLFACSTRQIFQTSNAVEITIQIND
jgi:hypothetical protein